MGITPRDERDNHHCGGGDSENMNHVDSRAIDFDFVPGRQCAPKGECVELHPSRERGVSGLVIPSPTYDDPRTSCHVG